MNSTVPTVRRVFLVVAVGSLVVLAAPSLLAFKTRIHADVTREALGEITRSIDGHLLRFQPAAIEEIVSANLRQDQGAIVPCFFTATALDPGGAFAVSGNHFDSEQLSEGSLMAIGRLNAAKTALKRSPSEGSSARRFLGRVLHAVQDYYAHSNWVERGLAIPDNRLESYRESRRAVGVSQATAACS
jgi:hypothetical protein